MEIVKNLVEVAQDSMEENEKPDVVTSMLKILLPKFYYDIYLLYLYKLEIFELDLLCYIIFV